MTKFSIIIPVRKINDYLRESIPYLMDMKYKEVEVLLITDELEKYDFKGDSRFLLIASGTGNPAEKRNLGAKHSKGDILVFMDDDAYPREQWLENAEKVFDDPNMYALGGPAMTPPNAGFLEKVSGWILESALTSGDTSYRHIPDKRKLINDYPTVNLMVRKEAFNAIGGFSTEFWPGEDTKLCLDLVENFGRDFVYDPSVVVYHHRRNVFLPHLKQISRYGKHRGQFAIIFPETSRVPTYFVPAFFVLGLIFGPLLSYFIPILFKVYISVLVFYAVLVAVESIRVAIREKNLLAFLYMCVGIFLTHLVYGVNFLYGLVVKPTLELKKVDSKTGNYSEG